MIDLGGIGKNISMKSRTVVCLDMGSSAVKLLEANVQGDKFFLTRIGFKKLQNPSRENLADSVRSLIEESGIQTKEVSISVSGQPTIVRFVAMPKMIEDELKGAIKFEAEKHIPFAIEDCIVDYQILEKDAKDNKAQILLAAAKKAFVLERMSVAEECGLQVNIIDLDPFAAANSFLKNFSAYDQARSAAILNMGASLTNLSIVQGGLLRFSRDVAVGGGDFTAAVSKSLGIDAKASEELKAAPGHRSQEIINFTKNVMNSLIDELRLSFSYYENQSGKAVDEVYICGGASAMAGLENAFNEAFESKPVLWNPLQFFDLSRLHDDAGLSGKMSRYFAVAAGLASR